MFSYYIWYFNLVDDRELEELDYAEEIGNLLQGEYINPIQRQRLF